MCLVEADSHQDDLATLHTNFCNEHSFDSKGYKNHPTRDYKCHLAKKGKEKNIRFLIADKTISVLPPILVDKYAADWKG
ncbi:MAG: hypothetical protein ABFC98_07715 [Candidatus Cloacimonas sp.]